MLNLREKKVTQAAAQFLKLHGGPMQHLRLIKLLYLADRESIRRWSFPISFDRYFSLPYGPVLSKTLDLIKAPDEGNHSFWRQHISRPIDHEVKLQLDPGDGELSDAECDLIKETYRLVEQIGTFDLVDDLHKTLPEWKDPNGSRLPITYLELLAILGKTSEEAQQLAEEWEVYSAEFELL